jgi:hypothetical protein
MVEPQLTPGTKQVRNLYKETASLLRATLPAGVKLIIEEVPVYFAVSGEPAELQQVILNLCTNAAQAMVVHPRHRRAERRCRCLRIESRRAHAGSLPVPFGERQRTRFRRRRGAKIVRAVLHDSLGGHQTRPRDRARDRS